MSNEQTKQLLYDKLRAAKTIQEFDCVVKDLRLLQVSENLDKIEDAVRMAEGDNMAAKAEHSADETIIGLYNKLKKTGLPTRVLVVQVAKAYANAVLITYQRFNR